MQEIKTFAQRYNTAILTGFIGIVVGFIMFVGIRLAFQPNTQTHYHANFAVFINGQRQEFKDFRYFEEVQACAAHDTPRSRVHMHDNNDHVVHVHDNVVTWTDFFTNLGWSLNDKMLFDGKVVHTDVQFLLNGQKTGAIANEVIGNEDKLLISVGSTSNQQLQNEFTQIPDDAKEANSKNDPASCKGVSTDGFWDKLRKAWWY